MSIRIPTAGDFEQYKKLQINCFPDIVDRSEDFWEQVKKSVKWDYGLVYELDGEIVSSYMIHDFKMYVRGRLMSVGGIYGVATYPEHRRKGYVKELIVESLIRMRQRGQYLSALNPFKFEYYRKYGYEIGALNWVVESDPNNIVIPDGFKPLTLKGFSKVESYEAMKEVRHKVGKLYNFIMLETYPEWRFHKFWDRDKLFAAMDGDTVAGYIISRVEEHGNEYVLRILDLVARNERARLTLLDYVKKHGDQVKKFKWFSLGDEPLTDYFYENWEDQVKTQVYGSVMFRVVDVWKALEKLV